jgi:hypothetical protein
MRRSGNPAKARKMPAFASPPRLSAQNAMGRAVGTNKCRCRLAVMGAGSFGRRQRKDENVSLLSETSNTNN